MKLIQNFLFLLLAGFLFPVVPLFSQHNLENWQHQPVSEKNPNGIRTNEWYPTDKSTNPKTIIVAVLDSGVDIEHPDLKDNIWVNPNEIAGNQKDDDGNGYVDDISGWNFIGGPNGQSVVKETFEVTRLYGIEKSMWEKVDTDRLKGKKRAQYEAFLEKKKLVESKREGAMVQLAQVIEMEKIVMDALHAAKDYLNGDSLDLEVLEESGDEEVQIAARIIRNVEEQGVPVESVEWLMELAAAQFIEQREPNETILNYSYNVDYDSRKIVGDVYRDYQNRFYGNNDPGGEFSFHGTHVAGIIGAVRDNDMGVDGIVDQVAIMSIKIVPDGDERDKDIANAIMYAVDNGALVINMSFGKGFSPEKFLVDKAMKYAAKRDVLLVLGSGNEGSDVDQDPKFPNDTYEKKSLFGPKRAPNLLSVGALSPEGGEYAVAEFSNYGKKEVDVFAPGVYIYSTTPNGSYEYASGTSMAAPVVSGIAALIRSRYPALSAVQVKDIIINSVRKLSSEVIQPGTFDSVSPTELSVSGGMVDVVNAMKLAAATKGKAKQGNRVPASEYVPAAGKA